MSINRNRAAELAQETLQILDAGCYRNSTGDTIEIRQLVQRAVQETCSYPPDERLPDIQPGNKQTDINVENGTTLAVARRLVEAGHRTVALNFASAKNPGGGFLSGARAQEESLARASALYACIVGNPMYEFHKAQRDPMYSNYAIYSPDVPVFRADDGTLLEQPYLCSFITSPAVNAKVVLERDSSRTLEIQEEMRRRIQKILTIAAIQGHETLVLGAWGCGVFGNNTQNIAELFQQALAERFRGVFSMVVFAVLDDSKTSRFIGPFNRIFRKE